jgi:hypothetical protein
MKNMEHMSFTDYFVMFVISLIAGFLSTMSIWADNFNDMRTSINDVYMVFLMTGWMFLFMGLYYKTLKVFIFGLLVVIINIWCIRTQFLVTEEQYKLGMIPHHSMAVHMSKKLLEKNNNYTNPNTNPNTNLKNFLTNLINTQQEEIKFLKM